MSLCACMCLLFVIFSGGTDKRDSEMAAVATAEKLLKVQYLQQPSRCLICLPT